MRINMKRKERDFGKSIVDLYDLQHTINSDRNEIDELRFKVNEITENIQKLEKFAEENLRNQLTIANEYYTLEKLEKMRLDETDLGKERILKSIIQSFSSSLTHSEVTIQQLLEVDPSAIEYISQANKLNVFGRFQNFLQNVHSHERD